MRGIFVSVAPLLLAGAVDAVPQPHTPPRCRAFPGDVEWPSAAAWKVLNLTVGGRLVAGVPLGRPCFNPGAASSAAQCAAVKAEFTELEPL